MWFKIKSFILFLVKSSNQHGVHSPFVYDLVAKCFYRKNNNNRKVTEIAKISGVSSKKSLLLLKLLEYFKPQHILEIDTSVGLGTATLSIGNTSSKIITLESSKNTAEIAQELFDTFKLKNIQLIIGNFDNTLPSTLKNNTFDLTYFNGNHQKEVTLKYFNWCLKTAHNNSIFIFDDIYWSSEMQQAWLCIKDHPKVTVSIDTYSLGIIFFRKEQEKEHFTIRV